jgi:hypothetical protein
MSEMEENPKASKVGMTAIIVTGVVAIFCILACTGVALAFILNAPW